VRPTRRELLTTAALAALAACNRRARHTATPTQSPSPHAPATASPTSSVPPARLGTFVQSGPRDVPAVALTFHGSGDLALAHALLDEAESAGAHVTVFAVGRWLAANPSIAERLRRGGHEPANHTYTHPSLGRLPAAVVRTEIARCADVLRSTTGSVGAWFRPSALAVPTPLVIREAVAAGYPTVVGYDVDSRDFTDPGAAAVYDTTMRGVRNGSIVSLHLGHRGTVDALPRLLNALRDKGFHCVTTSALLH
jgi:peptidoglycan/xylan/chitin deacetylase (PgdA/CDA1 family)